MRSLCAPELWYYGNGGVIAPRSRRFSQCFRRRFCDDDCVALTRLCLTHTCCSGTPHTHTHTRTDLMIRMHKKHTKACYAYKFADLPLYSHTLCNSNLCSVAHTLSIINHCICLQNCCVVNVLPDTAECIHEILCPEFYDD